MSIPSRRLYVHLVLGSSCAAVLALGMAAPALAAGPGYSGTGPSTGTAPTGFSSIVTATTVGSNGGTVKGKTSGGTVSVTVPGGASNTPLQVAITKGSGSTVKKDLSSALRKDKIVAEFGVELRSGSSATTTSKQLTVTFSDKSIAKGDIVVVYNQATGKFTKVAAIVKNGRIVVHLEAGESIAILAPPTKK
jgi:hypothetical protein